MKVAAQSGQSTIEYALLLAVVAAMATLLFRELPARLNALEAPLKKDFKFTYRYGDPKACGTDPDEGEPCTGAPDRHPGYRKAGSFRIFARGPR